MTMLKIMLAAGMIGHAINLYCDRILSIFPNGTLKLANVRKLREDGFAAKLMEGVSPDIPMRSGVLGVFSIVLEFCGYAALAAAILTGAIRFPVWAVLFTVLPLFLLLFPLQIIGTLHIAAIPFFCTLFRRAGTW